MMSYLRFLAPLLAVIVLTGCTQKYVPSEKTFSLPDVLLPAAEAPQLVKVSQPDIGSQEITIFKRGAGSWVGDLNEWSEVAARLMRLQLEKKNYQDDQTASKSLVIRVVDASASDGFWTIRAKVSLTVETGDGEKGIFRGENGSPANLGRAVDGALMFAVNQALDSTLVIDYLAGAGTREKVSQENQENQ